MKPDNLAVAGIADAITDTNTDLNKESGHYALDSAKAIRTFVANANLIVASIGLTASYVAQGGMSIEVADTVRHHMLSLLNLNTAVAEDTFFPVPEGEEKPEDFTYSGPGSQGVH